MTPGKDLEAAVTSALPEGRKAYFFNPILLWHRNGSCYGVFGSANAALAWQRGADAKERYYFYLTDAQGRRVTLEANSPGHAAAILDTLERGDQ